MPRLGPHILNKPCNIANRVLNRFPFHNWSRSLPTAIAAMPGGYREHLKAVKMELHVRPVQGPSGRIFDVQNSLHL